MVRVLFLCIGNTCRSQMAEGFAKAIGKGYIEAYSAGIKPEGFVNPYAIKVMSEIGIDINGSKSKLIDPVLMETIDIVVTLCGDKDSNCPALKRADMKCIHIPVSDPSGFEGSEEEKLAVFRETREEIGGKVNLLMAKIIGL
jgi:arsenate reductase (thioredoxin)